jgi:hypothetical protein
LILLINLSSSSVWNSIAASPTACASWSNFTSKNDRSGRPRPKATPDRSCQLPYHIRPDGQDATGAAGIGKTGPRRAFPTRIRVRTFIDLTCPLPDRERPLESRQGIYKSLRLSLGVYE